MRKRVLKNRVSQLSQLFKGFSLITNENHQLTIVAAPKAKVKRVIKSRQSLAEKQPGTTIFPISRVKRIIKADKEVDVMSTEATFLIAAATVSL